MLVLFLLGLMIIIWDVYSIDLALDQDTIFINLETQQRPAFLVVLPGQKAQETGNSDPVITLNQKQLQPLFTERDKQVILPAKLEIFLNRPLHINRADEETLQMLPGIGPHLAGAICAQRQNQGEFASAEDLQRIHGIGPARLQQLLPLITFE